MKQRELNSLMEGIAGGLAPTFKLIGANFDKLEAALAEAKHRLNQMELEKAKTFADWYRGTHLVGSKYERGLLVTSDGSLWLALKETSERPGNSADWKMVVKAGRPGKDAVAR